MRSDGAVKKPGGFFFFKDLELACTLKDFVYSFSLSLSAMSMTPLTREVFFQCPVNYVISVVDCTDI